MSTTATLDRSLLYERVREELRERCAVAPGSALPSLRQLSHELDVNYLTVSRALRDLEMEGLVEIIPRKGIYVRDNGTSSSSKTIELVTFYNQRQSILDISSQILNGMEEAGGTGVVHGSTLRVPPLPDSAHFLRTLQDRRVGAVLFLGVQYLEYPHSLDEANFIRQISDQIPAVIMGCPHQMVALDCVYADPCPQLRLYLEQAHHKGLRRFEFLGLNPQRATMQERVNVFKDFLLQHQLKWDAATYQAYQQEQRIDVIFEAQQLPEVLVIAHAPHAIAAVVEAHRRGIKLGQDMHILTISSIESLVMPILNETTVILADENEVGKRAYELAEKKLLHPEQNNAAVIERVPGRFLNNLLDK